MWKEESISVAVVRQARCSSRQLVNSALIGNGYAPTGAFLSICTGPPARSMRSSRVLGASVVAVVVDMGRSPSLASRLLKVRLGTGGLASYPYSALATATFR